MKTQYPRRWLGYSVRVSKYVAQSPFSMPGLHSFLTLEQPSAFVPGSPVMSLSRILTQSVGSPFLSLVIKLSRKEAAPVSSHAALAPSGFERSRRPQSFALSLKGSSWRLLKRLVSYSGDAVAETTSPRIMGEECILMEANDEEI